MVDPTPLRTAPVPRASEKTRAEVITLLKEALADAEAGAVEEVFIIMKRIKGNEPGLDWSVLATPSESISEWVGFLERAKFDWLMMIHNMLIRFQHAEARS